MQKRIDLLDYGYLKYVNHMGSDEEIIEDARMSTAKGFLGWGGNTGSCSVCGASQNDVLEGKSSSYCTNAAGSPRHTWTFVSGDEKLLRYLRENRHTTPFEGCVLKIECQAPIMVYREWHRHRTQSYSEMSARYTPLPDVNYVPTVERLMLNSKTNRQAGTIKDAKELTEDKAELYRQNLIEEYKQQQELYEYALKCGVPKELARVHLGVGRYSRMRATANLKNWLDFMTLRSDFTESGKKAQYEIRQYANAVGGIIEELFPRTWALFVEGGAR